MEEKIMLTNNTLAELAKAAQVQTAPSKGFKKTKDDKFPVFATPVNEDILVYIPTTNVANTPEGPKYQFLTSHLHGVLDGKFRSNVRCIHSLINAEAGYDGTCPFCTAANDAKNLFFKKVEAEAKRLGIDPQNDPNGLLKSVRSTMSQEIAVTESEEYITFPAVVLPMVGNALAPDWVNRVKVCFVTWTKKRFDQNIADELVNNGSSVDKFGGTLWRWNFSYDTGGKQANARDSAKNAKYRLCPSIPELTEWFPKFEEMAKDFTNTKAIEVITELEFFPMNEVKAKADRVIAPTRQFLSSLEQLPTGNMAQPQIASNPLAGVIAPPTTLGMQTNGAQPVQPIAPVQPTVATPQVTPQVAPQAIPTIPTQVAPQVAPQTDATNQPPTIGFTLGITK